MKNKKLTTYQMSVTALMAAAMCVLQLQCDFRSLHQEKSL